MQKHQGMKGHKEKPIWQKSGAWAWGETRAQSLRNEKSAIVRFVKAQNDNVWSLETYPRQ